MIRKAYFIDIKSHLKELFLKFNRNYEKCKNLEVSSFSYVDPFAHHL